MIVHQLCDPPSEPISDALTRFEEQFTYSLGEGQTFRISHGEDYPRFFRAMGNGVCFVAESNGRIAGVLAASIRQLTTPTGDQHTAVYCGDLKIDPAMRRGKILLRLADAVRCWTDHYRAHSPVTAAYAVVMDGTAYTPASYTGRLGIPRFSKFGSIAILRRLASQQNNSPNCEWIATPEQAISCYKNLSADGYFCSDGRIEERSETPPTWLMKPNGLACGCLEDTRRAKRLITSDGLELRSAHLSYFAYQSPREGVELFRQAATYSTDDHATGLFAAIPYEDATYFQQMLEKNEATITSATVFGVALEPDKRWYLNTSEI